MFEVRRYDHLREPTASSCGWLQPSTEAFLCRQKNYKPVSAFFSLWILRPMLVFINKERKKNMHIILIIITKTNKKSCPPPKKKKPIKRSTKSKKNNCLTSCSVKTFSSKGFSKVNWSQLFEGKYYLIIYITTKSPKFHRVLEQY